MKRYLPAAFALLFLFVFVFSLAATATPDVEARSCKCLGCCMIPANAHCSAEYGQIYACGSVTCSCHNYLYCMPSPCKFWCKVCF